MEPGQKLLKLASHHSTFNPFISNLRQNGTYTDVMLVCDGKLYPLHKCLLAFCSEYFNEILEKTMGTHPMVIITGIHSSDLELLLDCMYSGEVYVRNDNIPSLIKAADLLRVKNLIIQNEEHKSFSYTNMSEKQCPPLINNSSTDLSLRDSCTLGKPNPDNIIDLELDEKPFILQHSLENIEEAKGIPRTNVLEDLLHTECSSTDFSDSLLTIKDEPLSMSDYDGSDLVGSSKCTDEIRITKSNSDAVAEIPNPPLKRRKTGNDASTCDIPIIPSGICRPTNSNIPLISGPVLLSMAPDTNLSNTMPQSASAEYNPLSETAPLVSTTMRLQKGDHFPDILEKTSAGRNKRRRCVCCNQQSVFSEERQKLKTDKLTDQYCTLCGVALCSGLCWKVYHTVEDYRNYNKKYLQYIDRQRSSNPEMNEDFVIIRPRVENENETNQMEYAYDSFMQNDD